MTALKRQSWWITDRQTFAELVRKREQERHSFAATVEQFIQANGLTRVRRADSVDADASTSIEAVS